MDNSCAESLDDAYDGVEDMDDIDSGGGRPLSELIHIGRRWRHSW